MIAQAGIVVFGMLAIWCANSTDELQRRLACLFGLAAQPFWFYETASAGQWGIFAISFVYAYSWYRGFRRDWWSSKA